MVEDFTDRLPETERELALARQRIAELEAQLTAATSENATREENRLLQHLTQRLEGMRRLDHSILSANSLESLAEMALDYVVQLIPCFRAAISTVDLKAGTAIILALYSEQRTAISQKSYQIEDAYISPIRSNPYFIIDQPEQSPSEGVRQLYKEGIRSILVVPLRAENNLVGLLNLHSVDSNYFTEERIQIACEVANQIAIGIHKTTLSDALARYVQRMEILRAIDLGLIQRGSIKALIERTLKELRRIIPCERIGVGVIQQSTQEIIIYTSNFDNESELPEGTRIPIPPGLFEQFNQHHIRLVNNLHLSDDPTFRRLAKEGYQSNLQVLLRGESESIGILGLSSMQLNFFTSEHQEIVLEVATRLAIALHQMQLATALERYAEELEQRVVERTSELQLSKDKIEAILHNSLDGILLVDRDLRIQQANPAVHRLLAVKAEKKEPVNLLELIHPDEAHRIQESVERAIMEQNFSPVEVQAFPANGNPINVEFSFGYIPGDGLVSTIHDITARKQTEAALREALIQERELANARSRFISVTSHEFRTPLTIILSAADILANYRARLTDTQVSAKLDKIRQSVQHLTRIMDDILELTKIQLGRIEFHPHMDDFDALCCSLIEEFTVIPENVDRLIYSGSGSPVLVLFDPRLMRLVVSNLLSNALKYSPSDQAVDVNLSTDAERLILCIQDRGIGIPPEDLKRLFEPFHRASNVGTIKGTGLGLSIAKEIIEMHGGQITVESKQGEGSTVCLLLPLTTG